VHVDGLDVDVVREIAPWTGTAAELLARLKARAPRDNRHDPRQVAGALRRLAPALRKVEIEVEFGVRQGHEGRRLITVTRKVPPAQGRLLLHPSYDVEETDDAAA
jgi:hypothetical protein